MGYLKPMRIGNVRLKNNLFLAPMVDVTDLAFRELCRKQGAGMAYTEMIYVDAILHENQKTLKMLKTSIEDKPIGLQITGKNVSEFEKLAKLDLVNDYDLIDINCGCPSIRITGNQAGSYLLNHPNKISDMIKILKNENLTVTAKIRLGFKKNNVVKIAKSIEKAGADALTVHPRLANQGASIPADWKWIKKVKQEVGIPVIGNGDIFSGKDVERIFSETDCDGVMIARGAIGNPFVFKEILRYFKTGKEKELSLEEKIKSFKQYLVLVKKHQIIDMGRIKYLGGNFLKGFDGASKLREKFMRLKNFDEILEFVRKV
ncbi:tRNA-dihydrouridine synthase [Candidatus Pacearchaeota archaeon CG10_big_fil_rev_8_21_14_0_10_34_76]|nr:MAG: tRNA-dihydrouridine synthase [Candidatus Pacearchaeota archaeon CG10_big_fil_rev_8_21_14_0_10_34_76]